MDDRMTEAAERANGQVEELMRRMSAKAVFGEPIEKGDVTLIPVASVMYGFGTGQGRGQTPVARRGRILPLSLMKRRRREASL